MKHIFVVVSTSVCCKNSLCLLFFLLSRGLNLCSDRQLYSGSQVVMAVSSERKNYIFILEIQNANENESRPNKSAKATKH